MPKDAGVYSSSIIFSDGTYVSNIVNISYTVNPATPTVVTWPTAGEVSTGDKLSDCTLTGGSATGVGGAAVPGTFEWTAPDTAITTVGSQSFGVTFKPGSSNYSNVTGTVTLNATKGITYALGLQGPASDPFAAGAVYGESKTATFTVTNNSEAAVSGVSAYLSGEGASGFSISSPISPSLSLDPGGTATFEVTALGTNNVNTYSAAVTASMTTPKGVAVSSSPASFSLAVTPATPTVTWPTAGEINVGDKLSACTLTGGSATGAGGATVTGTFEWTAPDTTITAAGSQSFGVTFKPGSSN